MNVNEYVKSMLQSTRESTVGLQLDMRYDVADFIRRELAITGMTQTQLALKMKMKDSQLTRILNAESNLTLETVARIFHAFSCRPTISERQEVSATISEDHAYRQAAIYEPQNKYMIAGVN